MKEHYDRKNKFDKIKNTIFKDNKDKDKLSNFKEINDDIEKTEKKPFNHNNKILDLIKEKQQPVKYWFASYDKLMKLENIKKILNFYPENNNESDTIVYNKKQKIVNILF